MMKMRSMTFVVVSGIVGVMILKAQADSSQSLDADSLAKQLSNPIASLISVPAQVNVDFGYGGGEGWRSTTNLQPVAPIDLNKQWNLISRTILPAIFQDNINGSGIESGIGDTR